MKRIFTTLLLVALISNLFAEIGVKSFRKLENDLDARVTEPLKDQNGDICAIIKVVTTQTGFSFDCGMTGIVKTVQKSSEIWVYLPYGAKRITITHPQLGMIRDYFFTVPIEKATVYELQLITGRVETTVVDEMSNQWLVINPEPKDAMIYINDNFVKSGMYQAKVKPGVYTYRVEMSLYHNAAGTIEITDAKKEVNVKLKPAFGFFSVTSEPESGAKVIVEGKPQVKTTPFQSEALTSGIYTVQVVKEMYQPLTQKVTVIDGQTTPINFVLQPNFADITINAPANAEIYINNQYKGTGTLQQKLSVGNYSIEARRDKHRPAKRELNVVAGAKENIDLQPIPIFGSLDIMTDPSGASILIDGKENGSTPNTINKLPIGECNVQLKKSGYATINKTVTINDGRSTELNETLLAETGTVDSQSTTLVVTEAPSNERKVTINSNPTGAKLYIDGNLISQTPYTGVLTVGNHILRVEQGMEKVDKTVYISQTGGETDFKLTFAQQAFIESTNGIIESNQTPATTRNVSIISNPVGINLYIDGNLVGQTPYSTSLSFGSHNLRIEQNGVYDQKTITLAKSGGETDFNMSLPKTIIDTPKSGKSVHITSEPSNADVYVDGKFLGQTPVDAELTFATHNFVLNNGTKKNTQDIEITRESSINLYFELLDCNSNKTITSNPSGAKVLVNGEEKGYTPFNYTMLNKEDAITINQKGYKTYKETIYCDGKGLSANLKPNGNRTRFFLEAGLTYPLMQKPTTSSSSTTTVSDSLTYSFTIGIVKTVGIYAKFTSNFSKQKVEYTVNTLPSNYYYETTSAKPVYYTNRRGMVAGLMLNLKPVVFYAGAGYGYYNHFAKVDLYEYSSGNYLKNINLGDKNSCSGLETNGGLILCAGPITFSFGVSSIQFKYTELTGSIGLIF